MNDQVRVHLVIERGGEEYTLTIQEAIALRDKLNRLFDDPGLILKDWQKPTYRPGQWTTDSG